MPKDGVIHRKSSRVDLLEVVSDISEAKVEALKRLELIVDAGREGADGDVADISEEVLDTNLFSFLSLDY